MNAPRPRRGWWPWPLLWIAVAATAAVTACGSLVWSPRARSRIDPAKIEISHLTLSATGDLSGDLYNGADVTVWAVTLDIRMCGPGLDDPYAVLDQWGPKRAAGETACGDNPTVLTRHYRIPANVAPLSSGPVKANLGLVWDPTTTSTWASRVVAVERRP
jgi:hypothetical protein